MIMLQVCNDICNDNIITVIMYLFLHRLYTIYDSWQGWFKFCVGVRYLIGVASPTRIMGGANRPTLRMRKFLSGFQDGMHARERYRYVTVTVLSKGQA